MDNHAQDAIIVVSGPPRSGTSLMMSVLQAAGVPLLVDGVRTPDLDNPHGYFEYERVKALPHDSAWLPQARGKAVKIVYRLLQRLPATYRYRVLFMERAPEELITSQNVMLRRKGLHELASEDVAESARAAVAELREAREWLAAQPHCVVLPVSHRALLQEPLPLLRQVCSFLELPDRSPQMAARVDPTLYRNREGEGTASTWHSPPSIS